MPDIAWLEIFPPLIIENSSRGISRDSRNSPVQRIGDDASLLRLDCY
ncbi:MAG: hypothetical protein ACRC1Z_04125 [Waterburya sp.]